MPLVIIDYGILGINLFYVFLKSTINNIILQAPKVYGI